MEKDRVLFKWMYAVAIIGSTILVLVTSFYLIQRDKFDPDRARFMLECTYDWMLSPEQCRDILGGKDPVTPPPDAGC